MTARPVPVPAGAQRHVRRHDRRAPRRPSDLVPLPSPELLRRYGTSERRCARLPVAASTSTLAAARAGLDDAAARPARHPGRGAADRRGPRRRRHRPGGPARRRARVRRGLARRTPRSGTSSTTPTLESGRLTTRRARRRSGCPRSSSAASTGRATRCLGAVLAGLAHRLIAEWPANDPVGRRDRDAARHRVGAWATPRPRHDPGRPARSTVTSTTTRTGDRLRRPRSLDDPAATLFAP